MKTLSIMNFVRQCDPRSEAIDKALFQTTEAQLKVVNELKVENTFLLQYDAMCDDKYVNLFKTQATEKTEFGLWFEVVKQMTDAVGLEYQSPDGWTWDWRVRPGFLMSYSPKEREMLIDEAMRKFKEVFGYYPKSVASWLIDTHSLNYLNDHYNISAFGDCRDQIGTDAYTLVGGYFNQGYYPSRTNMHTPAQSQKNSLQTPMFRLLGACPIHNYDGTKYLKKKIDGVWCYTMEAVWCGKFKDVTDWFYDTYYKNEDMGFSYMQIGQENSFGSSKEFFGEYDDLASIIKMNIERVFAYPDVKIMKMCDIGDLYKKTYDKTPTTSVVALDNWNDSDCQSAYYNTQKYVANIFRHNNKISLRSLYLFDDRVKDVYLVDTCETFDARYENQPIVDSLIWDDGSENVGMYLDFDATSFKVEKVDKSQLKAYWNDKSVTFTDSKIVLENIKEIVLNTGKTKAEIKIEKDAISYVYNGFSYELKVEGANVSKNGNIITLLPTQNVVTLTPVIK